MNVGVTPLEPDRRSQLRPERAEMAEHPQLGRAGQRLATGRHHRRERECIVRIVVVGGVARQQCHLEAVNQTLRPRSAQKTAPGAIVARGLFARAELSEQIGVTIHAEAER
jgi:hypothetical protein